MLTCTCPSRGQELGGDYERNEFSQTLGLKDSWSYLDNACARKPETPSVPNRPAHTEGDPPNAKWDFKVGRQTAFNGPPFRPIMHHETRWCEAGRDVSDNTCAPAYGCDVEEDIGLESPLETTNASRPRAPFPRARAISPPHTQPLLRSRLATFASFVVTACAPLD
eukprot:3996121-Prymnesium_polylepis.1